MAGKRNRRVARHPHWIEWLTGLVSTALVLALIGTVTYHAITSNGATADLSVAPTTTRTTAQGFELSFIIANAGKLTAAGVPVTGRLLKDGQPVEEREITFDYVPAQSHVDGALQFLNDPAAFELDLRASGYRAP